MRKFLKISLKSKIVMLIMYLTHSVYQRQRREQKVARCKRPQVALRLDQVPENLGSGLISKCAATLRITRFCVTRQIGVGCQLWPIPRFQRSKNIDNISASTFRRFSQI